MPMPQAAEELADNVTDTVHLTRHAVRMMTPKPSLWHRIWYGAQAERKLAAAQAKTVATMQAPLDEVKAGVLAEMQSISRTQGGVSGSPFTTVMLPQGARANAKVTKPVQVVQAKRALPVFKIAILALLMVLGYVLWQNRTAQMASLSPIENGGDVIATGESATQQAAAAPKVTVIEWAKPDGEAAPEGKAVVGAVRALQGTALATALPQGTPPVAAKVQNQANVVWLSTGLVNKTESALRDVRVNVVVRDSAGVELMQREVVIEGPVAAGATLPPQRVVLDAAKLERFVAQVPLSALQTSITPKAANASL
jgi:hypothetical protein